MVRQLAVSFVAVVVLAGAAQAGESDQDWDRNHPGEIEGERATDLCPANRHRRSPAEVINDFHAQLAAGELHKAVVCNYGRNAQVMTAGGVFFGHAAIESGLAAFGQLFGATFPVVAVDEASRDIVFLVYSLITPTVSIPDGADTYVIRRGLIRTQTVHATIVFSAP